MKRPAHGLRKGFTLLELIVVVFLILFLLFLMVPLASNRQIERAHRVQCASKLRQIGQALRLYAQDNKGAYPQVRCIPGAPLAKFTKPEATNPFADNGPAANDVTAAMFLLIRTTDLSPEIFVCPSTNHDKDTLHSLPATSRSNFSGPMSLSYSFAHPYPDDAAVRVGYKLSKDVMADFVIAADRNECENRYKSTDPDRASVASIKQMNSRNHESEVQNVLYNDGHVELCTSPFVGANRDHIYTRNGATGGDPMTHQPENALDTILLPAEP